MIRYRVVVAVGASSLKKVLAEPVQGQRYVAQLLQMRRLSDACPDVFFYFLVGGRTRTTFEGLDFLPYTDNSCICVEKVPTINWLRTSKFAYHSTATIAQFSQEAGASPVHAWVSMLNVSCWDAAYACSSGTRLLPVYWFYCAQEEHPKGIRRPTLFDDRESALAQIELSTVPKLDSFTPVFTGPHQAPTFKRRLRKVVNSAAAMRFMSKAVVQPITAVPDSYPEPLLWAERSYDIGYFGRPDAEKNIGFITSVLQAAKIEGEFERGVVTCHRGSYTSDFLEVKEGLDQDAYKDVARRTKVLFYASKGEGFCFTVLECALLGVVPVLPRLPWVMDNLFAQRELASYPFIYEPWDEGDARQKLRRALAEGEAWVSVLRIAMSRAFGDPALNRVLVDHIRADVCASSKVIADPDAAMSHYRCVDRAKELISVLGDEFKFSAFFRAARKGAIDKGFKGRPLLDVGEWYVILQHLGYKDVGGHDPLMRKE